MCISFKQNQNVNKALMAQLYLAMMRHTLKAFLQLGLFVFHLVDRGTQRIISAPPVDGIDPSICDAMSSILRRSVRRASKGIEGGGSSSG